MINDFLLKSWFDLLQSIFIVGGFLLSYRAIRNDVRSKKVEYLLQINQSYREIWAKTYAQPELLRIKKSDVDLVKHPITEIERRIVKEGILHIYAVYVAMQHEQFDTENMEKDIADYLILPIPNAIWKEVQRYYDKQFIAYIDTLLNQLD